MHLELRRISAPLVIWCVVAAIGGVCSLILPSYLIEGGVQERVSSRALIAWFATGFENARVAPSMLCFFGVGLVLGIAQPRYWLVLAGVAMAAPAVLNGINVLYDWTRDPTSHNLFPFEFLGIAFISSPILLGGLLGSVSRLLIPTLKKRDAKDWD